MARCLAANDEVGATSSSTAGVASCTCSGKGAAFGLVGVGAVRATPACNAVANRSAA